MGADRLHYTPPLEQNGWTEQKIASQIAQFTNIKDLIRFLRTLGDQGILLQTRSGEKFNPLTIVPYINSVRQGDFSQETLLHITSNYGLRAKVVELVKKEREGSSLFAKLHRWLQRVRQSRRSQGAGVEGRYKEQDVVRSSEIIGGRGGAENDMDLASAMVRFQGSYVEGVASSIKGPREEQQDRLLLIPERDAVVVVDGMGGAKDGAQTAQALAEAIKRKILSSQGWIMDRANLLVKAIRAFDAWLKQESPGSHESKNYTGAVVAGAKVIEHQGRYWVDITWAGDSDVVVIRNGTVAYRTTPDGRYEKDAQGRQRWYVENAVTSLPDQPNVKPNTERVEVFLGDIIVVASDGITDKKNVPVDQLTQIARRASYNPEAMLRIISNALGQKIKQGLAKPDNMSIAIMKLR